MSILSDKSYPSDVAGLAEGNPDNWVIRREMEKLSVYPNFEIVDRNTIAPIVKDGETPKRGKNYTPEGTFFILVLKKVSRSPGLTVKELVDQLLSENDGYIFGEEQRREFEDRVLWTLANLAEKQLVKLI
jgi:hypothetical protein